MSAASWKFFLIVSGVGTIKLSVFMKIHRTWSHMIDKKFERNSELEKELKIKTYELFVGENMIELYGWFCDRRTVLFLDR